MVRVLLVIDDYNELLYLQTILKKVGFDVEGLQSQKKFSDASLGFNPQVVVVTGRGHQIDGVQIGKSIRKVRGFPKILALRAANAQLSKDDIQSAGFDLVMDTPVNMKRLVMAVAALGDVDEKPFLEKLDKIQAPATPDAGSILLTDLGSTDVSSSRPAGQAPLFPLDDEDLAVKRRDRYEAFVRNNKLPNKDHFDRDRILDFNKKIRSGAPPEDIDQIEDERKAFVRSLFSDKKPKG